MHVQAKTTILLDGGKNIIFLEIAKTINSFISYLFNIFCLKELRQEKQILRSNKK
jgi:hypothetical protein